MMIYRTRISKKKTKPSMTPKTSSVIKLFMRFIAFKKSLNEFSKISWLAGKPTKIYLHANFFILLPIKPN